MKSLLFIALSFLCAAQLPAQITAPASETSPSLSTPAAQVHTSDYGFSYSLPLDWEIVDTRPIIPLVQQQEAQKASSESERKGITCARLDLTARYGSPASVIVVVVMPLGCFEKPMVDKDLPALALGVSTGLKKKFVIVDPVYGAYELGNHSLWVERAAGTMIDHPEVKRTVETVCTVLKKGVICWMAIAADQECLQTFEHGAVTLDGETAAALVPANAIKKNP